MLALFRRGLSSWIVLGFLGIVLGAIVITGVGTSGNLGDLGGSANGEKLASVGSQNVGSIDVSQRLQIQLENMRQKQPGLELSSLVRDGAVEETLTGLIDLRAIQAFANKQGIFVSQRMIDGEIADVEAFKGVTGQFDRNRFDAMLDQRNITEKQLRADLERDLLTRLVAGPATAAARPAQGLVEPYAGLMLETRHGAILTVPSSVAGVGTPPTTAELQTYYDRNKQRYTVPEMRSIRYALFDRSRFDGKITPTDAQIDAYFKKNSAKYAGRESRGLTQIIVQDQAGANAIAAKVKAGGDMNTVAKGAGVEALKIDPLEKAGYSGMSSSTVADAVFGAAKGAVLGPIKSGLGWHVVRVDSITSTSGKSLADARSEISGILAKEYSADAEADFIDKLENAADEGQTFDEVAKANGLTIVTTPTVTASGIAPTDPGFKPSEQLAPILKEVFQAEPEDDPVVLTINETQHALVDLDRVVPAAAPPLQQIAQTVIKDFVLDRASREAKKIAEAVANKANGGAAFATAGTATNASLRAPSPVSARRIDILQGGEKVPPPLVLMFSMSAKRAKVLEAPGKQGWFVVWLDRIEPGKASTNPQLIAMTQQQLGQAVGQEYSQQFLNSIKADLKVSTDKAAVQRLKKSLGGGGQ